MKAVILCIFLIFFVLPVMVFAEIQNFTTDKTKYFEEQTIFVSGKVDYNENSPFIIVRVLNPSESDFVFLDQISLQTDGNFKTTIVTGGPKWSAEGPYTILVTYDGNTQEKIIQYNITTQSTNSNKIQENESSPTQTKNESTVNIPQKQKLTQETISKNVLENLRDRVPGFPSLEKSPNYYFQRYESEKDYQNWFDSQFSGYTIQEVVGYPKTHIPNFPDNSNPPSYYIHRYETESSYQNWFDSQFPDESIYSILGFPKKQNVPDWIKINAGWWYSEKISDNDFVQGLQFLIQNKIIQLQDVPPKTTSESKIPEWIKNVAGWWSDDSISEDEFIRSLKYLIEQGIVIVN